jgi:hypothetical protein
MVLAGLGLIGVVARRRKKNEATVQSREKMKKDFNRIEFRSCIYFGNEATHQFARGICLDLLFALTK